MGRREEALLNERAPKGHHQRVVLINQIEPLLRSTGTRTPWT
jgi:hypothetical protein